MDVLGPEIIAENVDKQSVTFLPVAGSSACTPCVAPTQLMPNDHRITQTEDTEEVCNWHVRPIKPRLDDLETVVTKNLVQEDTTLTKFLSRLSKMACKSQEKPQSLIDNTIMNMLMEIKNAMPNLTETIGTIRTDVNHIMEHKNTPTRSISVARNWSRSSSSRKEGKQTAVHSWSPNPNGQTASPNKRRKSRWKR